MILAIDAVFPANNTRRTRITDVNYEKKISEFYLLQLVKANGKRFFDKFSRKIDRIRQKSQFSKSNKFAEFYISTYRAYAFAKKSKIEFHD